MPKNFSAVSHLLPNINTPVPLYFSFKISTIRSMNDTKMLAQPFRFLDLTPELRNLFYEHMNVATNRLTLTTVSGEGRPYAITLIRKGLPIQLLATCHQTKYETTAILLPKTAGLRNQTLRLLVDLAPTDSPLYTLPGESPFAYLFSVEKHGFSMPLPLG
jgi:hypothetical protein